MQASLKFRPSGAGLTRPQPESMYLAIDKLIGAQQYIQAMSQLLPILEADPLNIESLDRVSMCSFHLGDTKTALAMLEVIVENHPDKIPYRINLAEMRQLSGDVEGAIAECHRVLELDPKHVRAMYHLNHMQPFGRDSKWVARLRKLDKSKKLSSMAQAQASNTLGRVEAASGRFKSAFRHFARAKSAQKHKFDCEQVKQRVDDQVAHFQPKRHTTERTDGPRVIFVCGLPRSGTTLVESILTRHEQVGSVGETQALPLISSSIRQSLAPDQNFWEWMSSLSEQDITLLRGEYFRTAFKGLPNKKQVIVDKLPFNCLNLGLAQILLPEAKFLFMVRHPLDVGLSNFSTNYGARNRFSARLPWIGAMTREVYRSAEDYAGKIGDPMRFQSFRALVQNPAQQVRAIVDYADLPWQEACLSPEQGNNTVLTASTLQVREKINTKGLDKWKACEEQLQPLVDALGGPEWLQHWQDLDDAAGSS